MMAVAGGISSLPRLRVPKRRKDICATLTLELQLLLLLLSVFGLHSALIA